MEFPRLGHPHTSRAEEAADVFGVVDGGYVVTLRRMMPGVHGY